MHSSSFQTTHHVITTTMNQRQHHRIRLGWTVCLWLAVFFHGCHGQTDVFQADDNNDCRNNLYSSDADGDGRVDQDEYVTFVRSEGPDGFLPNVDSFVLLPIMLQSNFYTLACLCRTQPGNNEGSRCCVGDNAHLSTNGTAPDETPTEEQGDYLSLVCGLTARAIDAAVEEQTDSPTEFVTDAPSAPPSMSPTASPVMETLSPTTSLPTASPTVMPTAAPTDAPSTVTPTVTASPTSFLEPVPVIIKTTYSILVPNGLIESIPSSRYEQDLIDTMDLVSQNVADGLNVLLDGDGRTPAQLRRRRLFERRRLEILVNLPTTVDAIENVGFTADPQLINGTFIRGPCPLDLGNVATDLCEEVSATIALEVAVVVTSEEENEDNNPLLVYGLYAAALDQAILNGDLVEALEQVNPDAVIDIASGQLSNGGTTTIPPTTAPTGAARDDERSLSNGAIGGIAAGALFVFFLICWAISQQRAYEKRYQDKKKRAKADSQGDPEAPLPEDDYDSEPDHNEPRRSSKSKKQTQPDTETTTTFDSTAYESKESAPLQSNLGQQLRRQEEEEKRTEMEEMEEDAAAMLAATVPYISPPRSDKSDKQGSQRFEIAADLMDDNAAANIPYEIRSTGNISHESEAGWSEAYTSSMGSVSDDELLPDQPGSPGEQKMILSIGPNSPLAQGSPKGEETTAEEKLGELEGAIMAGDWAAVGATAAALANMQESQSSADVSKSSTAMSVLSSLRAKSLKEKIGSDKAEDLDRLIEAGDWEGIILAAAKYEADENGATNAYNIGNASVPSSNGSQNDLMVHEDNSDSEGEETGFFSEATSKSSGTRNHNQNQTQDEYRATIMSLVEQVVPEEVDHVDEMLEQFLGREEELIETLETMQERAEAQNSAYGRTAKSLFKGTLNLN
jgi:hypothetical protein